MALPKVLIVDDDEVFQLSMRQLLKHRMECKFASNVEEAEILLKSQGFQVMFLDIRMRTEREGLDAIPRFREMDPDLCIVMASGLQDFDTVREAMLLGATDYIPKALEPDEILHRLNLVVERRQLKERNVQAQSEAKRFHFRSNLIGTHPKIDHLRRLIEKVRNSWVNVVITGETGTGKELVARSLRPVDKDGNLLPFVAIDSSTIQSTMAESLLFGHEKGAFTGATEMRRGAFEEANGGVIYFDEIANMPLEIQSKLLRVIQEQEISRLGSSRVIPLRFQVICATNQRLDQMVAEGKFKEDLYQRLNVVPLFVPPLRERTDDLLSLIDFFCEKHSASGKKIRFSEQAMRFLMSYPWPGNVRELNNLIAYLATVSDSDCIEMEDLPPSMMGRSLSAQSFPTSSESQSSRVSVSEDSSFYDRVQAFEKDLLLKAYDACDGNVSKLAQDLKMDRSHLYTKLKAYQIRSRAQAV